VSERLLVVDDDEGITDVVARVARAMGFDVVAHSDPRAAVLETNLDLIVTDFMMPHLSGIEVLRHLRETNPGAVRVLFTAASDFKVATQAVNDSEVFRLLAKPWHVSELRNVLAQARDYHRLISENRRLQAELAERNDQLSKLNFSLEHQVVERTNALFEGMIRALDYRDTETQWHSWRVARFTRRLAEEVGLGGAALMTIEQGALLHDIGKIGVRDSILLKPGPLTPEEWVEMKKHPEYGWRMLSKIPFLNDAATIVYQHQERWDGRGYPQALKGEQIVIGARIFCIADTMDAICSDRPYRKGSPLETAIAEIGRLGGTQFDPTLVDRFVKIPSSEWVRIRAEIDALAVEDKRRVTGEIPVAVAPVGS
jgi:putative nucleotidyltransferase with HDIG domain